MVLGHQRIYQRHPEPGRGEGAKRRTVRCLDANARLDTGAAESGLGRVACALVLRKGQEWLIRQIHWRVGPPEAGKPVTACDEKNTRQA
jgi:hypothetical protein